MFQTTLRRRALGLALPALLIAALLIIPGGALAADADVDTDAAFQAALGDGSVSDILLTGSFSTGVSHIGKGVDLGGNTLTVGGGVLTLSGSLSNGTLSASEVRLDGGGLSGVSFSGKTSERQFVNLSGVTAITGSAGTDRSPSDDGSGSYWTDAGTPSKVYIGSIPYTKNSLGNWEEVSYSITYTDAKGQTYTGLTPSKYKASELPINLASAVTIDRTAYTITGYQGLTGLVLPAGTTGDYTAVITQVAAASGGAGSGSMGGGGAAGGGGGGGVSVTTDTTAESAVTETATGDTSLSASAGSMGGRVSIASSTTRSTVPKSGGALADMPEKAETKASFPWALTAAGLLVAGGLTGLGFLWKRRSDEKMAATLEKLHIR